MPTPKRTALLLATLALLVPAGAYVVTQVRTSQEKTSAEFADKLNASVQGFFQAGQITQARDAARQWTEVQPKNAQAWREYGNMAAASGDLATAKSALEQAVALNPEDADAHLTLGGVLFAQKKYPESEKICRTALTLAPQNAQAMLGLARVLIAQKKSLKEAEKLAQDAVYAEAGVALTHFTLGQARLAQGNGADSTKAILRGLALDPANPFGYDLLAQAYQLAGNRDEQQKAQATAEAIRKFTPANPEVPDPIRVARGEALLEKESYKEALAEYIAVIKRDKTNAGALEGAGLALWQLEDRATGSTYLSEAIRQDPGRVRARIALAIASYEAAQYEGASRLLKVVTHEQPNNAIAWHLLGRARATQQMHDIEAEEALRKAVQLDGQNKTYLMDLADTLVTNNKLPEAEESFRKALALNPDDPEVNGRFGAFLASLPDPEKQAEAQKRLETALKFAPGDPYCQYHLGKLFVQQEKYAEGVQLLENATKEGQGRTKDVWSVLARGYQKLGNREKATAAIAEADRIQKENDAYDKATERLAANLNDPQARLEMARAAAGRGEPARALAEYESYLRRKPGDTAVRKERDTYSATLKRAGNYPNMNLYARLNAVASQEKP
ncbi:MAG: hypothetical protein OHK0029_09750 [Armatimonadaceae bacterium]